MESAIQTRRGSRESVTDVDCFKFHSASYTTW